VILKRLIKVVEADKKAVDNFSYQEA